MRPILSIGLIVLLLSTAGCANPVTKVIDKLTDDEPRLFAVNNRERPCTRCLTGRKYICANHCSRTRQGSCRGNAHCTCCAYGGYGDRRVRAPCGSFLGEEHPHQKE